MPYRKGSLPPYQPDSRHHGSRELSRGHTFSYYPENEYLHFYRWTSPPGVIKILSIIIVILCVAIFACVASTLVWDTDMMGMGTLGTGLGTGSQMGGFGGTYGGYGNYAGGSYLNLGGYGYGSGYGGIGGNYTSPQAGKSFIIAIAALVFIAILVIFILVVSRHSVSCSHRFYLGVIIICSILAIFMFISTIVYLVAINPTAQSSGSIFYNQIVSLCAQYQNPQPSAISINQYLYHYCVVEPQEAVSIVFGFLVTIGLIVIAIFASRTRQNIWHYGRKILWAERKVVSGDQGAGEWVKSVSGEPENMLNSYPDEIRRSNYYLDDTTTEYAKPPYTAAEPEQSLPLWSPSQYNTVSEVTSSIGKPQLRPPGYPQRVASLDNDYATGVESGEELDDSDFDSEFPPITNDQMKRDYKREFERDHKEFKVLQAELDDINKGLQEVGHVLQNLQPGGSQYLDALNECNRLKNLKKSAEYQMKKKKYKYLKAKLSHIKKKVNDYDRRA